MLDPQPILSVKNLSLSFRSDGYRKTVIRNITFDIFKSERVGIVGESGSGKTVTALSIMGLHNRDRVEYTGGEVIFNGKNLLHQKEDSIRKIRGVKISMIFQEPSVSMNPVYPVGQQLVEPLIVHEGLSYQSAKERVMDLLNAVELKNASERFADYPHVFSGGELQRIMLAMALSCRPDILIADEPTTALDVTIQAEVLELLKKLQNKYGMAVLLISHNLNLMQSFAERVLVMKSGEIIEQNKTKELFDNPKHEYTIKLMASMPRGCIDPIRGDSPVILAAEEIVCHFTKKRSFKKSKASVIKAVDSVSIDLKIGETLGIVGESGSGKSTLAKCLLQLQQHQGNVVFQGINLSQTSKRNLRLLRKDMQIVFQDPYSSLSPRMTVKQILGEGMRIHYRNLSRTEQNKQYSTILEQVDLSDDILNRYPHEFSGGQRQRIAIARVMILKPKLVILDEPTSSLDVSVQKQILTLLGSLQAKYGIGYLFISHDLNIIRSVAHRVVVMRHGRVVEQGNVQEMFANPKEDYTRELLMAAVCH